MFVPNNQQLQGETGIFRVLFYVSFLRIKYKKIDSVWILREVSNCSKNQNNCYYPNYSFLEFPHIFFGYLFLNFCVTLIKSNHQGYNPTNKASSWKNVNAKYLPKPDFPSGYIRGYWINGGKDEPYNESGHDCSKIIH